MLKYRVKTKVILILLFFIAFFTYDVNAQANGTLEIRVTDPHGALIPYVTIYIIEHGKKWTEKLYTNGRTGKDGSITFSLPPGVYDARALGKGDEYSPYKESFASSIEIKSNEKRTITLLLKKFGSLKVKVVWNDQPVPYSEIIVKKSSVATWSKQVKSLHADKIGEVTISLPEGEYDIGTYSPGYKEPTYDYNIPIISEQTTPLTVVLGSKLGILRVRVVDLNDNPISFARVDVKPSDKQWNESFSTMTSNNRTANFRLPTNIYDVRARGKLYEYEEFEKSVKKGVQLPEDGNVLVRVQLKPVNATVEPTVAPATQTPAETPTTSKGICGPTLLVMIAQLPLIRYTRSKRKKV